MSAASWCLCSSYYVVFFVTNDRPSLFGFLLGATLTGAGVYYYVLTEYKASNDQLTEDIYVRVCI